MKHYRYHHELLVFVKERKDFWEIVRNGVIYLLAIVFMTVAYYIVYSLFFDTVEERAEKRENILLSEGTTVFSEKKDRMVEVIEQLQERDQEIYRTIFRSDVVPLYMVSESDYETYFKLNDAELAQRTMKVMRNLNSRAANVTQLMNRLATNLNAMEKNSLLAIPFLQPINNEGLTHIGASIGMRIHPFYKVLKRHTGIDFIAGEGADVFATAGGRVLSVERSMRGTGNRVEVDHGNGYVTTYSHLSEMLVQKGQAVQRGQVIARVGSTGQSMYPHLHYEVIKDGTIMDPLDYFFIGLLPEDYDMLRQLSISSGQSLD
ncbi:MAG: M23 family metallopeptidase [Prevotellaceae bacterium]|jgi:murein DD-endopeptidase MepM/ murein hydrolase activator NlpD|nr:M23 family metallopeptidase [Prevotellaceae bacterium]